MSTAKQTTFFSGMPGPYRLEGMRIKAIDHGKSHAMATLELGQFTTQAVLAHGKLFAASHTMLEALEQIVKEGECYCLDHPENRTRGVCGHCQAMGAIRLATE